MIELLPFREVSPSGHRRYVSTTYSNFFANMAALGAMALVFWIGLAIIAFILSAFVTSLYVRLVIRFMRKSLDREYRYLRGDYQEYGSKRAPNTVPRNW